jgi:hypothetical protein
MTVTFEVVREWAIDRATDWALDEDGRDRLAIDDLPAVGALRVEVFNVLVPLAAAELGIGSDFGGQGVRQALKDRGLDRSARLAAMRLMSLRSWGSRSGPQAAPIAFLSELATPSGMEPMLAVSARLPADGWRAIAAEPRTARTWRGADAIPTMPLLGWREERAVLARAARAAAERWAALRAKPPALGLLGHDLTPLVMGRVAPLVRRSLPWLAVEAEGLRRSLDAVGPRHLVMASDQHRWGHLAAHLARERGIRTLVLQHGLPQYRLGFVPLVADEIATWSERSDDWLVRHGAPSDRLVRLGNPRLDGLVRADRAAVGQAAARQHGLAGRPAILLALSPNDRARNLALLELALGTLASLPDAALIVKLHPGDGRWDEVHARVREAGALRDRTRIVRTAPLYPLLHWADAVLLHRSTVAVEALAAGTPVIVGAVGEASADDEMAPDLRLPEVADLDGLVAALTAVTGEDARRTFVDDRRIALERTCGPLDGRVAERIAAHLTAPD